MTIIPGTYRKNRCISRTPSLALQIWGKKFFVKKLKSLLSSTKVNSPTMNETFFEVLPIILALSRIKIMSTTYDMIDIILVFVDRYFSIQDSFSIARSICCFCFVDCSKLSNQAQYRTMEDWTPEANGLADKLHLRF